VIRKSLFLTPPFLERLNKQANKERSRSLCRLPALSNTWGTPYAVFLEHSRDEICQDLFCRSPLLPKCRFVGEIQTNFLHHLKSLVRITFRLLRVAGALSDLIHCSR